MNIGVKNWENISYRTRLKMVQFITNNVVLLTVVIVIFSTDSVTEHGQYLIHLVAVIMISTIQPTLPHYPCLAGGVEDEVVVSGETIPG